MANKFLFGSVKSKQSQAIARNEAGGPAYALAPKHALAQLATTGCLAGTFYASGEDQLDHVLKLADEVKDDKFLAKLAIYARERGLMKDMPAALLVILSVRDTDLTHQVFDRVVDNGRMLRPFVWMKICAAQPAKRLRLTDARCAAADRRLHVHVYPWHNFAQRAKPNA